jgi:hypothetical protein
MTLLRQVGNAVKQLNPLEISYEQFRGLVVAVLSNTATGQIGQLWQPIASAAVHFGFARDPGSDHRSKGMMIDGFPYMDATLSPRDQARGESIAWDLIIEGVIRPGLNDGNNSGLPHYHVTEFGASRLTHEGERSTPYDPDGYISRLTASVPMIDPIIVTYLNEATRTFRINCLLSSAVTLGCAAEKAMLLLIAAYGDSLPDPRAKAFKDKTAGKVIKRQVDEFNKMVESHLMGLLPGDLSENLDTYLSGVFAIIRTTRNEVGHPSGTTLEREVAYAHLSLFPSYIKKVYALISWLKSNAPLK